MQYVVCIVVDRHCCASQYVLCFSLLAGGFVCVYKKLQLTVSVCISVVCVLCIVFLAPSLRAAIWRPIYKDGDQYTNAKAINNTGNCELYFFVNTYKTACEQATYALDYQTEGLRFDSHRGRGRCGYTLRVTPQTYSTHEYITP